MSGEAPAPGEGQRSADPPNARTATASSDVFISYASQDVAVADAVVEAVERHGVKCWIAPRDVVPGEFYAGAIVRAIDAAKVIVLVLSENAATSQHVLREVERASSKRHPVVAFRIDLAPMPAELEYFLNTSQWLDASAGVEHALPKLVDAVQRATAAAAVATSADTGVAAKPAANLTRLPPIGRPVSHRLNRPVLALSVLIALGLGYFAADRLWFSKRTASEPAVAVVVPTAAPAAPAIPEKSVAVLPFIDMSEKRDQEYFSDGLSEELTDMLAKLPELRVPARTSSFYFKYKHATIADIAKALGVAHVLEGSVRKSGNTLRITAQLVRGDNGYHVWSETYDRKLDDIFKVQDEIAGAVVTALRVHLQVGGNRSSIQGAIPLNLEAYELYLKGRYARREGGESGLRLAFEYFRQALEKDPQYAPAYAGLADCYARLPFYSETRPAEAFPKARAAALKALQLDQTLAEAHASMAYVNTYYDWNWTGAEEEFRKALELDPNYAEAHHLYSRFLASLGRMEQARAELKRARELDPLSLGIRANAGVISYFGRQYDQAIQELREINRQDPKFDVPYWGLGLCYEQLGVYDEAITQLQKAIDLSGRGANGIASLGHAYGLAGRRGEALKILLELKERAKRSYVSSYQIALIHLGLHQNDQAMEQLENAFKERSTLLVYLRMDPRFDPLRSDPRFEDLLRRMGLQLPAQTGGVGYLPQPLQASSL
jgi:TolB-like protein/Flp pilus assembly protein TadD